MGRRLLEPDGLRELGVIVSPPPERWNRRMLRFARRSSDGLWKLDANLAAQAVDQALGILRAVIATGGTPEFVEPAEIALADLLFSLRYHFGIPVVEESSFRQRGALSELPPSEERLARLTEWPSIVGINAEQEIEATRRDVVRVRKTALPESPSGFYEQPDVIFVLGHEASPELIAEAKRIGIPVVAPVRPESDPTGIFLPMPGDYSSVTFLMEFSAALDEYVAAGRHDFFKWLHRRGQYEAVDFPWAAELESKDFRRLLKERLSPPQPGADADEVIAAWNR